MNDRNTSKKKFGLKLRVYKKEKLRKEFKMPLFERKNKQRLPSPESIYDYTPTLSRGNTNSTITSFGTTITQVQKDRHGGRHLPFRPLMKRRDPVVRRTTTLTSQTHPSGCGMDLDPNFIAIQILVYRNGEENDIGTQISISRKQYKHWVLFLDSITRKIGSLTPANHLWRLDGLEIYHFKQLADCGEYVAGTNKFISKPYGATKENPQWNRHTSKVARLRGPGGLDSHESIDIFLKNMGLEAKHKSVKYPEDRKLAEGSEFDLREVKLPKTSSLRTVKTENSSMLTGTNGPYGGSMETVTARVPGRMGRQHRSRRKARSNLRLPGVQKTLSLNSHSVDDLTSNKLKSETRVHRSRRSNDNDGVKKENMDDNEIDTNDPPRNWRGNSKSLENTNNDNGVYVSHTEVYNNEDDDYDPSSSDDETRLKERLKLDKDKLDNLVASGRGIRAGLAKAHFSLSEMGRGGSSDMSTQSLKGMKNITKEAAKTRHAEINLRKRSRSEKKRSRSDDRANEEAENSDHGGVSKSAHSRRAAADGEERKSRRGSKRSRTGNSSSKKVSRSDNSESDDNELKIVYSTARESRRGSRRHSRTSRKEETVHRARSSDDDDDDDDAKSNSEVQNETTQSRRGSKRSSRSTRAHSEQRRRESNDKKRHSMTHRSATGDSKLGRRKGKPSKDYLADSGSDESGDPSDDDHSESIAQRRRLKEALRKREKSSNRK